jgi:SAM-dependent methyltransferase
MTISVKTAKYLMKLAPAYPVSPDIKVGLLQEIFNHEIFLKSSEEKRNEIMFESSNYHYKDELSYPHDNYFGIDLKPFFENTTVLDLGCFTGGRSAAWFEMYNLKKIVGIDVEDVYLNAAKQFTKLKNIPSEFIKSTGENMPFADNTFDNIISFHVFEHVQDVKQTLDECYRILKRGGKLLAVFPSYYHPIGHHLSLVTNMPGLQCLFSGKTLTQAYDEIIQERGPSASWYRRESPELDYWEKCNIINGTTLSDFKKIVQLNDWTIFLQSIKPLFAIGRNFSNNKLYKRLSLIFYPLAYIPFANEVFMQRISFILQKG